MNFIPKTQYERDRAEWKCFLSEWRFKERQESQEVVESIDSIIDEFNQI